MERQWLQVEANLDKQQISAEVAVGATAFFLAIEDTRGAFISTLIEII